MNMNNNDPRSPSENFRFRFRPSGTTVVQVQGVIGSMRTGTMTIDDIVGDHQSIGYVLMFQILIIKFELITGFNFFSPQTVTTQLPLRR